MTSPEKRVRTTVRTRIVLAMSLVVVSNLVVGGFASFQYARAAQFAAVAAKAQQRSGLIAQASQRLTEFFSEASELALGMKASTRSEEISTEYGDLIGADRAVSHALERLSGVLPGEQKVAVSAAWDEVRTDVARWINTEAVSGGTPMRLRRMEDGSFRASVETDLYAPGGVSPSEMRRAVYVKEEGLRDGLLRRLARDAEQDARVAEVASRDASQLAQRAILVSIGLALLVAVAMSVWLYRSIATPLSQAKRFSDAVASGELDASIVHRSGDEIGALTHSVENMRDAVVQRLDNIRELAGVVLVLTESTAATLSAAETAAREGSADEAATLIAEAKTTTDSLKDLASSMLDA